MEIEYTSMKAFFTVFLYFYDLIKSLEWIDKLVKKEGRDRRKKSGKNVRKKNTREKKRYQNRGRGDNDNEDDLVQMER